MDTVAQLLAHLPTPLLDDSTKIRAALHAISLQVHQAAPASLRPDLLAALKTAGVASLKNRQAAANHVCRALRERQAVDAAADQGSSHAAVRPGCGRVRLLLHPTASGRVAASVLGIRWNARALCAEHAIEKCNMNRFGTTSKYDIRNTARRGHIRLSYSELYFQGPALDGS